MFSLIIDIGVAVMKIPNIAQKIFCLKGYDDFFPSKMKVLKQQKREQLLLR